MNSILDRETHQYYQKKVKEAQHKVALPLRATLEKITSDQYVDVLLTLSRLPAPEDMRKLKRLGLKMPLYYEEQPDNLIPGVIRKSQLEHGLIHCDFIDQIDGRIQ